MVGLVAVFDKETMCLIVITLRPRANSTTVDLAKALSNKKFMKLAVQSLYLAEKENIGASK
jgi:hypothetical protein